MTYEKLVEFAIRLIPWRKLFRRKTRCLLIVDDNEADGEFLKALVSVNGHDCEVVNNGEAALSLITRKPHKYPICFCDLRLPLMGGLTLISKIRAVAPAIHIIAVAGLMDDLLDIPPGLYVGVIAKPITAGAVKSVIEKTKL